MDGDAPDMLVFLPFPDVASGFTAMAGVTAVGGFTGKVFEASIS